MMQAILLYASPPGARRAREPAGSIVGALLGVFLNLIGQLRRLRDLGAAAADRVRRAPDHPADQAERPLRAAAGAPV